ncbi:MAG: hypothetical protein QXG81_05640 [Ignisphaera sp.]
MGWWNRLWRGPYPGNGPWSHLPPWQRPGWLFGGGGYWLQYLDKYWYQPPITPPTAPTAPIDPETEIRYLEELRRYISDVMLKEIDARIEELRRLLGKGQGSR